MTERDGAYFDWMAHISCLDYPTDPATVEMLKSSAIKPGVKWAEFRLFLIYAFSKHGRYGKNMYAGGVGLSKFGISRPIVAKYLEVGVKLALIRQVKKATVDRGTTYEIVSRPATSVDTPDAMTTTFEPEVDVPERRCKHGLMSVSKDRKRYHCRADFADKCPPEDVELVSTSDLDLD